jgi:toxin ParE1/3/4
VTRVVLSELAETDLTDIWVFVARNDLAAADRLIDQIHETSRMLAATPKAGRNRPELEPSVRSFVVGNYIVFYRVSPDGIEVARVLHGHRDLPSLFRR